MSQEEIVERIIDLRSHQAEVSVEERKTLQVEIERLQNVLDTQRQS